jgi:hypothetical protein
MRSLSISSYALMARLQCPGIGAPLVTPEDIHAAAMMWHYIHTAALDDLMAASDADLKTAIARSGFDLAPGDLAPVLPRMAAELKKMNDAFVETETDSGVAPGPLVSMTATSPISPSA